MGGAEREESQPLEAWLELARLADRQAGKTRGELDSGGSASKAYCRSPVQVRVCIIHDLAATARRHWKRLAQLGCESSAESSAERPSAGLLLVSSRTLGQTVGRSPVFGRVAESPQLRSKREEATQLGRLESARLSRKTTRLISVASEFGPALASPVLSGVRRFLRALAPQCRLHSAICK